MARLRDMPASLIFLGLGIFIYALFGSPTPDDPGLIEALLGALLVLAVLSAGPAGLIDFRLERNFFLKALQVFFICGLALPTLSALYYGNDSLLILRDMIAFAFIGLPLFLSERYAMNEIAAHFLPWLMIFAGLSFALRTLVPTFNIWIPEGELLYLSNSPLALFAGAYFAGILWNALMGWNRRTVPALLLCLPALALLIAAMLLDVQRATIGAVFLTLVLLAIFSFATTPRRAFLPILALAAFTALLYPLAAETVQAIAEKTASVGLNARAQEAAAVFDTLAASPESLFIGLGWGSVFASPAVAGLDVNYTHSFLTTMALKGGLIMLALAAMTMLAALYQIFLIFQRDRVRGLALLWPLIIPVLLYASHKSFDFGLILLLTGMWSSGLQALRDPPPSVKTKEHL